MSGALGLLAGGVLVATAAVALVGALGLLSMRDAFARLHAASLIGVVAPTGAAIAASLAFAEPLATAKIAVFLAVALATTGIGTHATARALHLRRVLEKETRETSSDAREGGQA